MRSSRVHPSGGDIPSITDVHAKLRELLPQGADSVWGHIADTVFNQILSDAMWARDELDAVKVAQTKPRLRRELRNLVSALDAAYTGLRELSLDLERLVPLRVDKIAYAKTIARLRRQLKPVFMSIEALPRKPRYDELRHSVASELAVRILRTLKENKIKIAATADKTFKYVSPAVQLLKFAGDTIGLRLSALTWRDIVDKTKKKVPDLQ